MKPIARHTTAINSGRIILAKYGNCGARRVRRFAARGRKCVKYGPAPKSVAVEIAGERKAKYLNRDILRPPAALRQSSLTPARWQQTQNMTHASRIMPS